MRDLAINYPVYAIELESLCFGNFGHFHGHDKIGVELGDTGQFLMSLCFCENCRAKATEANIDIDRVASRTRDLLEGLFREAAPIPLTTDEIIGGDADLSASWAFEVVLCHPSQEKSKRPPATRGSSA